jgi:hypothetical protein
MPSAIDLLREQIAPKATDPELRYFSAVCDRLDLDPIAGQITFLPRWDGRLGKDVHRPQITADGRLVQAERTGEYDGCDGPEWCGPRQFDAKGNKVPLDWAEVWDEDESWPYAARCFVYRKGRGRPSNGTVKWSEFSQWYGDPARLVATWAKMPSHMLGKVALSLALRRAFSDRITTDVDVEDDFAPYERDPAADDMGEIVDTPGADEPDSGGTPAPGGPPGPEAEKIAAVEAVLRAMSPSDQAVMKAWRKQAGLIWPPESEEALSRIEKEAAVIAERSEEEADAYDRSNYDPAQTSPYD